MNKHKNEIHIKFESKPKRCEICHKETYFNAENNYCSLCSNVIFIPKVQVTHIKVQNVFQNVIINDSYLNKGNIILFAVFSPVFLWLSYVFMIYLALAISNIRININILNGEYGNGVEPFWGVITNFDFNMAVTLFCCLLGIIYGFYKYKVNKNKR